MRGQQLIAHELAHVGQQLGGDTASETEQEAQADSVARGARLSPAGHGSPHAVLRLHRGDAVALTIVMAEGGGATFTVDLEGGGTVSGFGSARNLQSGEFSVGPPAAGSQRMRITSLTSVDFCVTERRKRMRFAR